MERYIFSAGLGYLTGLGLHGYILLLYAIKKAEEECGWNRWGMKLLMALHYVVGLVAMFVVPGIYIKNHEGPESTVLGVLFAIPALGMVIVSLFVVKYLESPRGK